MTDDATTVMRLLELPTRLFFRSGPSPSPTDWKRPPRRDWCTTPRRPNNIRRTLTRQAAFTRRSRGACTLSAAITSVIEGILTPTVRPFSLQDERRGAADDPTYGKKLAELSKHVFPDETAAKWLGDIAGGRTPALIPGAGHRIRGGFGESRKGFSAPTSTVWSQYGRERGFQLRARASHHDTQRILFRPLKSPASLYDTAALMIYCYTFVPQIDDFASAARKREPNACL